MAITLLEAAKLVQDPLRAAVIEIFAMESPLMRAVPYIDIPGNAYKYNQEGTLPGIAFRGVNQAYTESAGVMNPVTEILTILGGDLDVDRFIVKTNGEAVRSAHEVMKIKAIIDTWQRKFLKGDSSSVLEEFDGLQRRLTGNQVISNSAASGGAALSLAKLDEMIDAVVNPTHIIMSKAMRRALTAAARLTTVGGYITFEPDEFGKKVHRYNELPIIVAESLAGVDDVLGFSEAYTGGGTSNGTSIYCVSLGEATLAGIQNGIMEVEDLGQMDSKPVYRTRVEWYQGIAMFHSRAAARLRNIASGAVTV